MADQPLVDLPGAADINIPRVPRSTPRATAQVTLGDAVPVERKRGFLATLDGYLLVVVFILLSIGLMMVYSTTFDWSYQDFGSQTAVLLQHARNMAFGVVVMLVIALIDYRVWRRLAVILLLLTIASLIAVLMFGDDVFNARRALINGSFQPGELAELVIVIYMATWLSSRRTKIRSITYGLLPFAVLVGIVSVLILQQPDISTAATIIAVAGIMFFLAGADWVQLVVTGVIVGVIGFLYLTVLGPEYAGGRLESFVSGVEDLTEANYHVQQAIIAFNNGGLTGLGLGQGLQKFGNLPAPHTDSIFAVIGEELGLVGATVVVLLYIALVWRGIQIARRSLDYFGALMAAGLIVWIAIKALLNIAVMTAMVPPTGASLPFISFGGSSLVVVMAGVGLMLSIARVRARYVLPKWSEQAPERRNVIANYDRSRGDRRTRIPSPGDSRSNEQPVSEH
jgi:cell division protein FtsW